MTIFFVGMHHPSDAHLVPRAFISVNRLRVRIRNFPAQEWIMDSGAFSTILKHGGYPRAPKIYAAHVRRWRHNPTMLAAASEDYMCEDQMLALTKMTVRQHQTLTIRRYDAILDAGVDGAYLMPVLQGYSPNEYQDHIDEYGERLAFGAWVGVGSVCKRNGDPRAIVSVLSAIKTVRPDLKLHGFGLKTSALSCAQVTRLLHSADSMAWSFAARKQKRSPNDPKEALAFFTRVTKTIDRNES